VIEQRRNVWSTPLGQATINSLRTEDKAVGVNDVLARIIAAQQGLTSAVTPENCMKSPTVHAIVTAISRRLSVTPVHVYKTGTKNGRATKEQDRNHPIAKLLAFPNEWQSRYNFWADAASCFIRYGRFYAYKGRGSTGPIRELIPLHASAVVPKQDDNYKVTYEVREAGGDVKTLTGKQLLHVRGASRSFIEGDSPVNDVRQSIALEIAAEEFGTTFFSNGALPLMVFNYMQGSGGFKTAEAEKQFITDFQTALGGGNRHKALLLPKGIETGEPVRVENDKAQFLETRKYQRTVIAGAFGVPPHLVGDLERATFNNVEQQDQDFTLNVIMPVAQAFEAAMERDLLTDADWNAGTIIRFNLDSILRADFQSRQTGLQMQRLNGVISADEWREIEGKNPLSTDDGGDEFWRPANMAVAGQPVALPPAAPPAPKPDATDEMSKALVRLKTAAGIR
jgi:HK97 family phage portal protein